VIRCNNIHRQLQSVGGRWQSKKDRKKKEGKKDRLKNAIGTKILATYKGSMFKQTGSKPTPYVYATSLVQHTI
jgi:hypothetical protein